MPDEEDDSIWDADQYEVVIQDKDNYGADRKVGEKEALVVGSENCEAAEATERDEGGSKATEAREPIELYKRKGGRPRKNERVFGGSDCDITNVVESYYSNSKSLHTPVNSEDEVEVSGIHKYPYFNEEMNISNLVPQIGMEFEGPS